MAPDGTTVQGRDAIQKAYADHFAQYPKHTVTVEPESLRFTSRDTALEEGHMTVTRGKDDPGHYRYVVLHVREDGKWQIAVLRNDETEDASLRDLEWLIGTWEAKGPDAEARTTYEWVGNKAFIRSQFTIREKDQAVTGTQMIGLDPNTGDLRTWTFEADGGLRGRHVCPGRRQMALRHERHPGGRHGDDGHEHPDARQPGHVHLAAGGPDDRRRAGREPAAGQGHPGEGQVTDPHPLRRTSSHRDATSSSDHRTEAHHETGYA